MWRRKIEFQERIERFDDTAKLMMKLKSYEIIHNLAEPRLRAASLRNDNGEFQKIYRGSFAVLHSNDFWIARSRLATFTLGRPT